MINFKKLLWGVMVIALAFTAYSGEAFYIKKFGFEPSTNLRMDYSADMEHFLQDDPRWAEDTLGSSQYSLAEQGCTITNVAMVLRYLGEDLTPSRLNKVLEAKGAYTASGNLLWYKLEEIYPIAYKFKRVFSAKTLEKSLKKGILPIVRVKYGENALEHWVVVVGADGSNFLILDPLNDRKTLTSLAEYGKIYAYRALVPTR